MNKFLFQYFPLIAFFFLVLKEVFVSEIYLLLAFVLLMPYLIVSYNKTIRYIPLFNQFVIVTLFFGTINLFFTSNGFGALINFLACISMALYLKENPRNLFWLSLFYCLYLLIFLWYHIMILEEDTYFLYEFMGVSRNYPGYLLVASFILWTFAKDNIYKTMPLLIGLPFMILAFYLNGRTSMGVIALLLIVSLFLRGKTIKVFILLSILVSLIIYLYYPIIEEYYLMSTIASKGTDTSRYFLWSSYISNLDLESFMFGIDTNTIVTLKSVNGNTHNTFLTWHSRMGIIPLLYLGVLIFNSLKYQLHRNNYVHFIVIIAFLFRLFFDSCINYTQDFILYYILLIPYDSYFKSTTLGEDYKTDGFFDKLLKLI